ncbi:sushi, von Willebrand factor type A, EGF and pentraxin domain-containing protein 1 [Oncorhynchus tshawytscha]|uniref:sushi, von Willebrand factor type A, EGF and pentraxin domain-containing protein 1 n=1 Tax=Oncorhynchus tshawytscha TaxID=74940 RepID=UPI001C3E815C|nr:sushi, von Willebrand factor type A, EGF and pentraxin domain-containing protein 1 [Oncorhynchus tshawytscha]
MGALTGLLSTLVALLWTLPPGSLGEECSSFRHVENGRTFFRYSGLYVAFTCNPGYKIHGYRTNSCVSGQWTREPPVCVASGCPSPGDLLQGVTSVTEDGSWALFSCDAGYRLYGHSLLYCKGQNWNGTKPVCKESDMMSSWKQKEPTVPMPRIQSQNLDVLSALKNHLQLHYNTIANTASKPVLLANAPPKDPHTHLKDPHSIDRSPKAHHVEEILKDTRDLTDREGAPEKPTRPQASTSSSATTETITSTSSLPVAEGYWHQGTFIAQAMQEDSLPRKAVLTGATQLEPVQGVTEPADVSSTDTQEPRPQRPTETSSTSFINSSNTTSHWVNGTDTYGHHIQVKKTASLSDDDDDDGGETHRRNVTSPDRASNGSSQDNETDTSDSHHSQANETSSSPLSGDDGETSRHNGTSSYLSLNRSDQHLIKGATNTEELPRPVTLNRRPLCPYPPLPAHGTFYFRTVDNPGPRDYKHYIQYACYAGYTLAHGDIHSYCLQAGRWSGLTPVCLEVTPCALNNGGCSQLCSVNQEQAQCHCRPGFILLEDHRTCRDVDECVEGQQQQRCQQTCVNTFGSFRCSCPYGHILAGDGRACVAQCPAGYRKQPSTPIPGGNLSRKECVDINECEEPEVSVPGHRCQWKCVNLPGSHRCICPRGYKLSSDRHHCRDINECSRKNGGCSHLCLNHKGSYQCSCPASHRLSPYSRKKCQPRKEQQSNV